MRGALLYILHIIAHYSHVIFPMWRVAPLFLHMKIVRLVTGIKVALNMLG